MNFLQFKACLNKVQAKTCSNFNVNMDQLERHRRQKLERQHVSLLPAKIGQFRASFTYSGLAFAFI